MRLLQLTAAALGLAAVTAGCSTIDKAQACIEANRVIAETTSKVAGLLNDPAEMEKALNDGAAKLNDVAEKAGNTTLNDALTDLASTLGGLNVNNANEAIDAGQRVATDAANTVEKIATECT